MVCLEVEQLSLEEKTPQQGQSQADFPPWVGGNIP